ncbi:DUF4224 domain-containing protein [Escherichia coli]|nr:DUF4224 domain-containing protein [Escherichia coli]
MSSHQRKWLMENGQHQFYTNRSGKPIVSRDIYLQ